jgi:N-acetylglucosaminyl-diphospho-decaprenol L-rhamnosyltransferase
LTSSAVIVTWNSASTLRQLLDVLPGGMEVIVVDNGSADDTVRLAQNHPSAARVFQRSNLGFGAACNYGAAQATGSTLIFMNPDILPQQGSIEKLITRVNAGGVGALIPRLADNHREARETVGHFPSIGFELMQSLGLWRIYKFFRVPRQGQMAVDWGWAACIAVPARIYEQIGGFDQSIFLYGEDMDLCKRIWNAGYKVLIDTGIVVSHAGNTSGEQAFSTEERIALVLGADYRFLTKYRSRRYADMVFRIRRVVMPIRARLRPDIRPVVTVLRSQSWRQPPSGVAPEIPFWGKR